MPLYVYIMYTSKHTYSCLHQCVTTHSCVVHMNVSHTYACITSRCYLLLFRNCLVNKHKCLEFEFLLLQPTALYCALMLCDYKNLYCLYTVYRHTSKTGIYLCFMTTDISSSAW